MNVHQWVFPDPSAELHVLLIGLSCGESLPSAVRDAEHLAVVALHRWKASRVVIVVENDTDAAHVRAHLTPDELARADVRVIQNKGAFLSLCESFAAGAEKKAQRIDLLVALSSHGYRCTAPKSSKQDGKTGPDDDCIYLCGAPILDNDLHGSLVRPLRSSDVRMLTLLDTCHSGTLLSLPACTTNFLDLTWVGREDTSQKALVASISACSDGQSSQDDVSSEFGFGGGLISAFLDLWQPKQTVGQLFSALAHRLQSMGQTPTLSSDHPSFLGLEHVG